MMNPGELARKQLSQCAGGFASSRRRGAAPSKSPIIGCLPTHASFIKDAAAMNAPRVTPDNSSSRLSGSPYTGVILPEADAPLGQRLHCTSVRAPWCGAEMLDDRQDIVLESGIESSDRLRRPSAEGIQTVDQEQERLADPSLHIAAASALHASAIGAVHDGNRLSP